MIKTVSQLLRALAEKEREKLDTYPVEHGPTIGSMYEGLASDVLNRALPDGLGLSVCSGIISDDNERKSGQIDCMIIKGEGVSIPYTPDKMCHVRDVLAVLEIKKTLTANGLLDAFCHVREVHRMAADHVSSSNISFDLHNSQKAFALTTQVVAPPYSLAHTLSFELETIYRALAMEQLTPVRIIWGFHGWKKEATLRKNLYKKLAGQTAGFGVTSFPQLIVGGAYSLVKANGLPYVAELTSKGEWPFFCSSRSNPVRLMLELLWTKIASEFPVSELWGDDQDNETLIPFLLATPKKVQGNSGWKYEAIPYHEEELRRAKANEWAPAFLTSSQYVAIHLLCSGHKVKLTDPALLTHLKEENETIDQFRSALLESSLVALDGDEIRLTTDHCKCAILPSGQFVAGEDNSGRLTSWIAQKYSGEA